MLIVYGVLQMLSTALMLFLTCNLPRSSSLLEAQSLQSHRVRKPGLMRDCDDTEWEGNYCSLCKIQNANCIIIQRTSPRGQSEGVIKHQKLEQTYSVFWCCSGGRMVSVFGKWGVMGLKRGTRGIYSSWWNTVRIQTWSTALQKQM